MKARIKFPAFLKAGLEYFVVGIGREEHMGHRV